MVYYGKYKCRMCGEIFSRFSVSSNSAMIQSFSEIYENKNNYNLFDMHFCGNDMYGLSDFIGFDCNE